MRRTIAWILITVGAAGFLCGVYILSSTLPSGSEGFIPTGSTVTVFSLLVFCIGGMILKKIRKESLLTAGPEAFNIYKVTIAIIIGTLGLLFVTNFL